MFRSYTSGLLAGIIGFISVTQAVGQQVCRPALAFKEVNLSEMQTPPGSAIPSNRAAMLTPSPKI